MERVKNLDEYKELLRWNKARFESLEKNCFLLASGMNKFILENRLYAEKYENGLVFFIDEGRYYNLYYFWKKEAELEDFRQDKPVLIEEINTLFNSRQSLSKASPSSFVSNSDLTSNLNQYSVSAVSFNDICNFDIKSALLCP